MNVLMVQEEKVFFLYEIIKSLINNNSIEHHTKNKLIFFLFYRVNKNY